MGLPHVGQASLLGDIFEAALRRFVPASVAVLGCAGGNGFERIQPDVTTRIVGVDLNPDFVRRARERFEKRLLGLELHVGDVQADAFAFAPVDLVFAGLLFEYVDPRVALGRIRAMLRPGGVLVAVLQLADADIPEVTPSAYASLGALASIMRLVPPDSLRRAAEEVGYRQTDAHIVAAAGGKRLGVQSFKR